MTSRHAPSRFRSLGWVFALLALLAQVTGAAAFSSGYHDDPAPLGAICSVGHPIPAHSPSPNHHRDDCTACPLCAAAAATAAVLAPGTALPRPRAGRPMRLAVIPLAHAPPYAVYHPGKPRGPPAFA